MGHAQVIVIGLHYNTTSYRDSLHNTSCEHRCTRIHSNYCAGYNSNLVIMACEVRNQGWCCEGVWVISLSVSSESSPLRTPWNLLVVSCDAEVSSIQTSHNTPDYHTGTQNGSFVIETSPVIVWNVLHVRYYTETQNGSFVIETPQLLCEMSSTFDTTLKHRMVHLL